MERQQGTRTLWGTSPLLRTESLGQSERDDDDESKCGRSGFKGGNGSSRLTPESAGSMPLKGGGKMNEGD